MYNEIKDAWKNCIYLYAKPGKFTINNAENSGALRRMINRYLLPLLIIASAPSFFILTIDYEWHIALFKTIINFASLYLGVWGVYGITWYYVTDSPIGNKRESYLAPLIINSYSLYVIPISIFYANELHVWRFIAGAIAIYYALRTIIAGVNNSQDIENNIKTYTITLIIVTTVTFPFLIQRIATLFFNLPIS